MRTMTLKKLLLLFLVCVGFTAVLPAQATCTSGACVSAGPRLASVDSTRSSLLNALLGNLLGNLLGTSLSLTVADWNSLAQGNIDLLSYLNVLQTSVGASSPGNALSANATLAQLVSAMATAAQADGNTATVAALNNFQSQVSGLSGTIRLGDLLAVTMPAGALSNVRLNVLDLISGSVQLYNYRNVLTTPTPVTLSGSALGLSGVINSVQLYAQVIEPPVYVCGPSGTQFHTAAIRVKLNLNLVTLNPDAAALNLLPGVSGAAVAISQLELYSEVARAQGTLSTINALNNTVTVQATPGVADLYLGSISDANFFNRGHVLNPAIDLGFSTIGTLSVNATTVNIQAKSYARGQAPFTSTLNFTGPYPQTRTASTSAGFVANLVDGLMTNLELSLNPSLGLLDSTILPALKTLVSGSLTPVLNTILTSFVDPLLELLGIRLGEVDVTVHGVMQSCPISGAVYLDANHNGRQDSNEAGTGLALYAKLIPATTPGGPAAQTATVDLATGIYSFAGAAAGTYILIVDNNSTLSDVAPDVPAGWIGTEIPGLIRSNIVVASADVTGQNFGLYNGSKLSGKVFKDNGGNSGTPNNGLQDGGETGLADVAVRITDNAGSITYDSTVSAGDGAYTLWIPASANASVLKVVENNRSGHVSVGGAIGNTAGSYNRAADTLSFSNAVGSIFSGVNFADVPDNSFLTDGQQTAVPGSVVFYPHAFTAGSGGQLSFSASGTANPNNSGWNHVIYLDSNCNGVPDSGEVPVSGALNVNADQKLCVVVKVFVAEGSAYNAQYQITVTASFTYVNAAPALTGAQSHTDLTTVGTPANAGLKLTKTVDKTVAKSGDVIAYTITYANNSNAALGNLKINDFTPAYTVLNSASCGVLPADLTSCALTVQPGAGSAGAIEWAFSGTLAPGGSGSVSFSVILQ